MVFLFQLTAYHESGHAIVAFNTDGAHPIHKATIMPRGSALGMVTQLPSSDETSVSKKQLLARLDVCMGGRVAEELIFGQEHVTTGASSDLHTATELAQYMVLHLQVIFFGVSFFFFFRFNTCIILLQSFQCQVSTCGMSDAIGPVYIKERPSSDMQSRIDAEVCSMHIDQGLKNWTQQATWSLLSLVDLAKCTGLGRVRPSCSLELKSLKKSWIKMIKES